MKKYEKTNAITLIALVITIVILLILAGVTIIALTGENGLINKIAIARKEQLESEAEEKLKLKIMELQTNIVDKEGRQAVLEDLNCWTNVESDYYDSEITSVTDSQENTNKLVEIDGYIFEVDENLNVVGVIEVDITSKTETTYQINSIDGDVMQVTIKIKNASGVEKVVTPEGKEIIPQTNKTEIAIDYEVTSGNNYTFKVKVSGSDEIKEYVLKADINAKPEIDQNESYAYPILTEYGVEINKTVEIDYGENTNNYYSIDNGETWNKYTETVKIQSECTLMAKTVIEGEITRETKKEITLELAVDALGSDSYDGDIETGWTYTYGSSAVGKVRIDESMQGKKMYIKLYCNSAGYNGGIKFYDDNNESISTAGVKSGDFESVVDIPENAIYFQCFKENGGGQVTVYEISVADDPIIKYTEINPTITESGIDKVHWDVTIEYHNTSIKKEYKIDDGNWCEYNGDIIRLEIGQTIYARGYNNKGNVTRITSNITAEIKGDSMGLDAYDGDIETGWTYTYGSSVVGKVKIDESMQGKKMYVKLYCNSYGYNGGIKFYDNNNESISTAGVMSGDFESVVDIPENATYFQCFKENGGGQVTVYEISTVNE